jgi:hypothetical protein
MLPLGNVEVTGGFHRRRVEFFDIFASIMNTTLDEWELLGAVVQLGGFAPAPEHGGRT